ncbi:MAG: hypothetical protein ACI84A_000528 [Pontimonas sp.]|jgi:hypothetical protein
MAQKMGARLGQRQVLLGEVPPGVISTYLTRWADPTF